MTDWEHRELENKISSLERQINDLGYDLRRAISDLEAELRGKADKYHEHDKECE